MFAYVETAGHSWMSTLGLCARAAVGDVGIILGIYAAGALAAGDLAWGERGRRSIYATAAVLGLAYAALVEHAALAARRWSYMERMPVVSVLGAGRRGAGRRGGAERAGEGILHRGLCGGQCH